MSRRQALLAASLIVASGGIFFVGLVAGGAWVQGRRLFAAGPRPDRLEPGVQRSSSLDLPGVRARAFTIDVPEKAVAMRIQLTSVGTELNLSASRGEGGEERGSADFSVATDSGEASLSIGRFTDPPISPGRWTLRVAWTSDVLPTTADRRLSKVPFTLEAKVIDARIDGELTPGAAVRSSLDEESGGFRTFEIEVPPGSRALRIDLTDVASDLDLYARRGGPVLALGDDVLFAKHPYGRETLVVGGGGENVEPGTWYVDVVDVVDQDRPAPFRILATLSPDPPAELLLIPPLSPPRAAEPVARALAAVVEIATDDAVGSGTILSKDGWILTNAHVVERVGGGTFDDVVVSASIDPRRPPVELFRAKVAQVDEDRDLALVRISSGFYGQPLPSPYVFPTVEMGDAQLLAIGDPIWLVGYPSTGGQGSRVTITCTRGVVSGFEEGDLGPMMKTDAEITTGNSGGAALDEHGRLVGVPTSMVELGSGQVAYVHPLDALPDEFRDLLRKRVAR